MLHNNKILYFFGFVFSNSICYSLASSCANAPTSCPDTKYRSYDGSCNNLNHPEWGMSETTYRRLLPAKYGDGIHSFPVAKSGKPLPGPRNLSLALYPDVPIENKLYTLNAMQYGQMITHDMSLNFLDMPPNSCCSKKFQNVYPCHPIQISRDDPDFSKDNKTCIIFARTATDKDHNCSNGNKPAEQISQVTHYLDLSNVFGYLENIACYMRQNESGRIRVNIRNGHQWPIDTIDRSVDCVGSSPKDLCYYGSDPRVNQNTQLTILQIIFLREHNRVADRLTEINPHWPDERVYQESRKIVIATHQQISYYEWLPIILGKKHLLENKILYETDGFVDDYNDKVDPSVLNEHAQAAFRFFHTQIAGRMDLVGENRQSYGSIGFSDWNFRPIILEKGNNFDGLTRGLNTQHQMGSDRYHDKEITERLFRIGAKTGLDLKSIDIQRSRDHGLASYNDAREYCGLPRARTFEEFAEEIPLEIIKKLSNLYESPDDVDLIIGGSLERNLPDALAGPTLHCFLLKQFRITRIADRFWFENSGETGFTSPQLKEIRKSSISRLLCDNGNNIKTMQARGFEKISDSNPVQPCDSLPAINLSLWMDVRN